MVNIWTSPCRTGLALNVKWLFLRTCGMYGLREHDCDGWSHQLHTATVHFGWLFWSSFERERGFWSLWALIFEALPSTVQPLRWSIKIALNSIRKCQNPADYRVCMFWWESLVASIVALVQRGHSFSKRAGNFRWKRLVSASAVFKSAPSLVRYITEANTFWQRNLERLDAKPEHRLNS